MAFCSTCGKEINDNAIVCPACGCPVAAKSRASGVDKPAWDGGPFVLLLVLAFFIPLAGWIIGGMNLKYPDRNQQSFGLIGVGAASFLIAINMMG